MQIAFCYENVFPERGGCSTYISDLARRLVADGHEVHLYACRWDAAALPPATVYHALPAPRGPRFWRPWRFAAACARALAKARHHVSIGFDKTWGQDVLYPQGGLHAASAAHNLLKYRGRWTRRLARLAKGLDLAHRSYLRLERRQYCVPPRPLIVVNSNLVARHFQRYYRIGADEVRVIPSAIDPERFREHDRPRRRLEWRQRWGVGPGEAVALFMGMNYRLKGIEPLLHAVRLLKPEQVGSRGFRLLVFGSSEARRFEQLARRLGVQERVRFLGYCGEPRNCYFASDFLVHPTFYDPCSLVVLEALACGLPVITSRYNGASELIEPPHEGYVVNDPHDHARLAWCLAQLLDPARRSACAQAARRTAAQWTFDHHYRQLVQVFAEAAARKRAA
jgi:UDP-glucose:(heptosyl)LPS alpha-1,3-glucosyltransferase